MSVPEKSRETEEPPLNLNNEMVLMRKEIRRAKARTISKLVRTMKNLRNKKGNETQVEQNIRRGDRLVEQMEILKHLKPDKVFKTLLQSEGYDVSDLDKIDTTSEQKAIIRIGTVKFIKDRMVKIKEIISDFHFTRSNKRTLTTVRVAKRLEENKKSCIGIKSKVSKTSKPNTKANISDKNSHPTGPALNTESNVDLSIERFTMESDINVAENFTSSCGAKDLIHTPSEITSKGQMEVETNNSERADVVIGTSPEGYQVVLPPFYAKKMKDRELDSNAVDSSNFNSVAVGAEDVTEVLTNMGDGFGSSDEDSDGDIEYEDLVKSGLKVCQGKRETKCNEKMENGEDLFFIDKNGSNDKKFSRNINKTVENKQDSDLESKHKIKSMFLGSLSRSNSEKKNRPSQRARQKSHFANSQRDVVISRRTDSGKKGRNSKKNSMSSISNSRERNQEKKRPRVKGADNQSLHPSWEASRKRKQQQSTLQQFQGKRVCFDDSD